MPFLFIVVFLANRMVSTTQYGLDSFINADDIICCHELCPCIIDGKTEAFKKSQKSSDQVRNRTWISRVML